MNARDQTPKPATSDLPEEVKAELLRRVQNLPNETLIPGDRAFEELKRRAKERNSPKTT